MVAAKPKSGIAKGLNKGHIVTVRQRKPRPSQRKGSRSDRVTLIRGIIREVAGLTPYEKRCMDILKGGGGNPTKRAAKFLRNRLGTHLRAKNKLAEMQNVVAAQAKAVAVKAAAAKADKDASKK